MWTLSKRKTLSICLTIFRIPQADVSGKQGHVNHTLVCFLFLSSWKSGQPKPWCAMAVFVYAMWDRFAHEAISIGILLIHPVSAEFSRYSNIIFWVGVEFYSSPDLKIALKDNSNGIELHVFLPVYFHQKMAQTIYDLISNQFNVIYEPNRMIDNLLIHFLFYCHTNSLWKMVI